MLFRLLFLLSNHTLCKETPEKVDNLHFCISHVEEEADMILMLMGEEDTNKEFVLRFQLV